MLGTGGSFPSHSTGSRMRMSTESVVQRGVPGPLSQTSSVISCFPFGEAPFDHEGKLARHESRGGGDRRVSFPQHPVPRRRPSCGQLRDRSGLLVGHTGWRPSTRSPTRKVSLFDGSVIWTVGGVFSGSGAPKVRLRPSLPVPPRESIPESSECDLPLVGRCVRDRQEDVLLNESSGYLELAGTFVENLAVLEDLPAAGEAAQCRVLGVLDPRLDGEGCSLLDEAPRGG